MLQLFGQRKQITIKCTHVPQFPYIYLQIRLIIYECRRSLLLSLALLFAHFCCTLNTIVFIFELETIVSVVLLKDERKILLKYYRGTFMFYLFAL